MTASLSFVSAPAVGQDADASSLRARLADHLARTELLPPGDGLVVAVSGGLDSVVLLDLLRALRDRWGWSISAAHYDHDMRRGSGLDAEWVRALCERLEVPVRVGRALESPANEAEARRQRYDFLHRARRELGARWLVTAHHADDQAETVLLRLLRGTGLRGLRGIPARRAPGVVRPLLPFWRSELEAYAAAVGLGHRTDPTNADTSIPRNRVRHHVIPAIEAQTMPRFRQRLAELATVAADVVQLLDRALRRAADGVVLEAAEGRIVVARSGFLAYDGRARSHLVRHLVGRVASRPGRVGTRTALEFIRTGSSGRRIELAEATIAREFDRLIIERKGARGRRPSTRLAIASRKAGRGHVLIAGARWSVRWGEGIRPEHGERIAVFDAWDLAFPLTVSPWQPGDRIRLNPGSRKLKRVFVDRRVGRSQRIAYPVVRDRSGVLWVVGLVQGTAALDKDRTESFAVCLRREG